MDQFKMGAVLTVLSSCIVGILNGHAQDCTVSTFGHEYRGHVNVTSSGIPCQRWDEQTPHSHTYNNSLNFPDRSLELAENYCRNPVPTRTRSVWCYTTDPDVPWQFCDVPICNPYPECKLTEMGEGYRGSQSTTDSGAPCESWPVQDDVMISNFCRNPDDKPEGPWCYTEPTYTQWEYCDVSFCKPSAWCTTSPDGTEYIGTIATTQSGIYCQRWDDVIYHISNYTNDADFPDATVADAADFCRNPLGDKSTPWCYTLHPDVEWDFCDIDQCSSCRLSDTGAAYAGTTAITSSGYICQRWDTQAPHPHNMTDPDRFPDQDLATGSNYCRNPDGRDGGPWCYTTDPDVMWQSCDVPLCMDSDGITQPVRGVSHVVHIGIDGLDPCFVAAPAPNMMDRIAAQGAWTMTARTTLRTYSGPGWTAILCGGNTETTGVDGNSWMPPWLGFPQAITPTTSNKVPIHCTFDVLKRQDHSIRTASLQSWKFLEFTTSTGLPGRMDYDPYCVTKLPLDIDCDNFTTTQGSEYFAEVFQSAETSYTFIYTNGLDAAGHTFGWCGERYMNQVRYVDDLIGYVLDTIEMEGMQDDVMVVVTSDHSGNGTNHGQPIDEHLITPLMFRGPGIKQNYQMSFEARNEDVPTTIVKAMGYKPSPWWKGKSLDQIFE